MARDFNDIIDNSHKLGGRVREISSFWDFKSVLRVTGAIGLGLTGKRGLGGALKKIMV